MKRILEPHTKGLPRITRKKLIYVLLYLIEIGLDIRNEGAVINTARYLIYTKNISKKNALEYLLAKRIIRLKNLENKSKSVKTKFVTWIKNIIAVIEKSKIKNQSNEY